jgi:hypothetical protein
MHRSLMPSKYSLPHEDSAEHYIKIKMEISVSMSAIR